MSKFEKRALGSALAMALVALAGCATPTPYQPLGSSNSVRGGYSDQQITDNTWRVSFVGNTLTSRQTVENYLLYRAAQLTVEKGYASFTIINRATDRDVQTQITPDPTLAGPYGWWRPSWRYWVGPGWRTWDPWMGGPFWADNIDVSTVSKYEATAEIVMNKDTPSTPGTFNARQVLINLGPTIKMPTS